MDVTKTGTRKTLERLVSCTHHLPLRRMSYVVIIDMLECLIYEKKGYDPDLTRLLNQAKEDFEKIEYEVVE